MVNPWDPDYRTRHADFEDLRSERCTSAPPPETSFLFGRNDGLVAPTASYFGETNLQSEERWGSHSQFEDRNHGHTPVDSLFLQSSNSQWRTSAPALFNKPPPGFSNGFGGDEGTSSVPGTREYDARITGRSSDMLDRRAIGENLIRSHSAAPSLDGRVSMGPPPGLANSETPLASNRTAVDSYLQPAMDTSRILQLGQRRPASTGVIGGPLNSSSAVLRSLGLGSNGAAVRPAAKTLMDLIQEDFPPESPLEHDMYTSHNYPRDEIYVERPRTTSPLSLHTRDYMYDDPANRRDSGFSDALDRLRIGHNDDFRQARPSPQYIAVDRGLGRPTTDPRPTNAIYAPLPQSARPQPQTVHQQAQFEQQQQQSQQQQPVFGVQPSHIQTHSHVQSHILANGQTVYLNTPPPQFGYTTVQYHPHAQQHHIVHGPNGEQYISVVPIQGTAPVQGAGPAGTYAYFHADGQPAGAPTYTIVNPHLPGANPITPNRNGAAIPDSNRQTPPGRGKDKGGRNRRWGGGGAGGGGGGGGGGATNNRRCAEPKSQSNSTSSPLLENFKAKKNRDWTTLDIKGHVVEFCQDQNGSRFIQQRLEVGSNEEKEVVIAEVIPAVRRLRNDVFGNYVVQKLLDFGTPKMKDDLRETLQGEMLQLSLQMYGCRVVQKALETLDDSDVPKLLTEFHNNVLSCIHDQNGNHVIQKCIEVMSEKAKSARARGENIQGDFFEEQIDFIVDDVLGNVRSLSCHPYGCRVLQRILEHCPEPKKSHALDEIKKCHRTLLDDQYGNYVIQHVLQFGRTSDRDSLLDIVVSNGILILSRQKFASNVVEKLLKYGSPEQRSRIVKEMLKTVDDRTGLPVPDGTVGTSVVLLMVRDAYANYVVQTTLDVVADEREKHLLMEELHAHSTELKNYTFAKHIVTKLESWSRGGTP